MRKELSPITLTRSEFKETLFWLYLILYLLLTCIQVYHHQFFQVLDIAMPDQSGARTDHTPLNREMKDMLNKVVKNKPRVQKPPKKDKGKKKKK